MKMKNEWADSQINAIKFLESRQQIRIHKCLYLIVSSKNSDNPSKKWYVRYLDRGENKQKWLYIGVYDKRLSKLGGHMKLADAIAIALKYSDMAKKGEKITTTQDDQTFGQISEEWLLEYQKNSALKTYKGQSNRFNKYIRPSKFYKMPIKDITRRDIMETINEDIPVPTKKKLLTMLSLIYVYADNNGLYEGNSPVPSSKQLSLKHIPINLPAITDDIKAIGKLVLDIKNDIPNSPIISRGLLFLCYCFCRPQEMRYLKWGYIDEDKNIITIPREIMKNRNEFIIPMSSQVKALLNDIKDFRMSDSTDDPFDPENEYVFHLKNNFLKPISDSFTGKRLKILGYSGKIQTSHGFRSIASTHLRQTLKYSYDTIEAQLAHRIGNQVERAYNRALYTDDRIKMMQDWANWIDSISADGSGIC
ncbi:MAG: tyrosine-type recombinase/integrase [Synergistota bacterium]|nr:tyrosine-type recombinase/integrase [Synergistota bacterium]